jgi:hypothetical protein
MKIVSRPVGWDGDLTRKETFQIGKRGLSGTNAFAGSKFPKTRFWDDKVVVAGIRSLGSPGCKASNETECVLEDIQIRRPQKIVNMLDN